MEVIPLKEGLVNFRGIKEEFISILKVAIFQVLKELDKKLKESIDFLEGQFLRH